MDSFALLHDGIGELHKYEVGVIIWVLDLKVEFIGTQNGLLVFLKVRY